MYLISLRRNSSCALTHCDSNLKTFISYIKKSWMWSPSFWCQSSLPASLDCFSVFWLHFQAGPLYTMEKRPVWAKSHILTLHDLKRRKITSFYRSHLSHSAKDYCFAWITCSWIRSTPVEKGIGLWSWPGLYLIIPVRITLGKWWASSQKERRILHKLRKIDVHSGKQEQKNIKCLTLSPNFASLLKIICFCLVSRALNIDILVFFLVFFFFFLG